jgi:O-acetyl-ADP-ribose deacetylase (regulator of RNase III)
MDAGENMRYPYQCIDGLVHLAGGRTLRNQLDELISRHSTICIGDAFITDATELLSEACWYQYIIHTVIPLVNQSYSSDTLQPLHNMREKCQPSFLDYYLIKCYWNSFQLIRNCKYIKYAASPLLGTGTAGFELLRSIKALKHALNDCGSSDRYYEQYHRQQWHIESAHHNHIHHYDRVENKVLRMVLKDEKSIDLFIKCFCQ